VPRAVEGARGHHACSHDLALSVDVFDEHLERPDALHDAIGRPRHCAASITRGIGSMRKARSPLAVPNETPRRLTSRATAALGS
jgi:hypothetical protein